jgi:hypothetical protein
MQKMWECRFFLHNKNQKLIYFSNLGFFQNMYCSENCLSADWSFAHKGECNNRLFIKPPARHSAVPFTLEEFTKPSTVSRIVSVRSILLRLISRIGLDNIKKNVLENKSMPSLVGDPRTKGFQDGKFGAITLEALLSLEDNFGKMTREELTAYSNVSFFKQNYVIALQLMCRN